jgi:hypothetical protein
MFILNGKPLSPDSAFTHDGVQYPANWMRLSTLEQKTAIGITEQPDPPTWNQEYYWGYDENGNLIPKDLEQLKELHIQRVKQTANGNLQPTDWYVTRKFERNIEIPVGITSYRATVIAVSEERETLIGLTTSVTELKELYESTYVGIGTSAITQAPAMPQWPNINN